MIKDIKTFRELIPTVTGQSLEKYTRPITDAAEWLRQRIVGPALMGVIKSQGEASAPELFKRAQLAVAYKAYLIAIPKMDVIETANGFAVVDDDIHAPASRDRVNALTVSMTESLSMAVAGLIEYLEDIAEYRAEWRQSPACTATRRNYMPTLRMFRDYGVFPGDNLDYVDAQPVFRSLIVKHIEPVISPEYSAAVLAAIGSGTLGDNDAPVVESLRLALAGYYSGDVALGDICLARARERLESSPDDFPAFRDSATYRKFTGREVSRPESKSILSTI